MHCLLHEIMWDSAHSWRRLQVRQNTYFCTVDNGDCIAYNQASRNMDDSSDSSEGDSSDGDSGDSSDGDSGDSSEGDSSDRATHQ